MPIEGLTEEITRLPRLGKIHLGIKVKKANSNIEYPKAVDYFVCPDDVREVYGDQPKELPIMLPVEDIDIWAAHWYECYSLTRGLVCKGDGKAAMRWFDPETGGILDRNTMQPPVKREIACLGEECELYRKQCKRVMHLQFLLPEVIGFGIWQIDTGSGRSMRNILAMAKLIHSVYKRVSMIPLMLTLEPGEIRNPQDGKMQQKHFLNLRSNMTLMQLAEAAQRPLLTAAQMPELDEEIPELIIPEAQEPEDNEPTPEDQAVIDFDAMRGASGKPQPVVETAPAAPSDDEPVVSGESASAVGAEPEPSAPPTTQPRSTRKPAIDKSAPAAPQTEFAKKQDNDKQPTEKRLTRIDKLNAISSFCFSQNMKTVGAIAMFCGGSVETTDVAQLTDKQVDSGYARMMDQMGWPVQQ